MSDIEIIRGDTAHIPISVALPQEDFDVPPTPVNLTNAKLVFTMKLKRPDGAEVFADKPSVRKTSDDTAEIEVFPQSGDSVGLMMIHIRSEDTQFLTPGIYEWDVRMTLNGDKSTVAKGRVFLVGDVGSAEDLTTP